mgnify:CR=1 FL=1
METGSLLEVKGVSIERGGIPLAAGISFVLSPGDIIVLKGANGSGKTTLLRTIAGLQNPLAGTITSQPDAVAYGAHADGLKSTMTVSENLSFWAAIYGLSGIAGALEVFDLQALVNRPAGSLSAGQKRRLGLARLLVTGRPLWALDEPTVSLDTRTVSIFADAVRQHQKNGGAAIIATHIDLGLDARVLEMANFPADPNQDQGHFDEVFL